MSRFAMDSPCRQRVRVHIIIAALLVLLHQTAACEMPPGAGLGRKLVMFARGIVQMALSTEGQGARDLTREPDASLLTGWATEERRVVFIRHGESTWNEIFNRGKGVGRFLWMPIRFARGLAKEAAALLRPESTFIDSPLSSLGVQQASAIREALHASSRDGSMLAEVLLTPEDSDAKTVIVSSNLLRAVETATLAFADRLEKTREQVYIRSELQEISRNLDTVALAPPLKLPLSPRTAVIEALGGTGLDFDHLYCADGNRGNKAVMGHPRRRLARFAAFCFGDSNVDGLEGLRGHSNATVIVTGHSLWFRTFFRMYIDKNVRHKAKERKISNAGVVAFTLERGSVGGRMLYRIRADSIHVLHGQFV